MKKIISLLLSLALLCSVPVLPAAAAPGTDADLFEGAPWTAKQEGDALWLDLGADRLINRIHLSEETYGGVQSFHIEAWNGTDWTEVYRNDYILTERDCILPEDVTASAVRLVVDKLAGDAVITAFSADHQENSGDSSFMNVGYVSRYLYMQNFIADQLGYQLSQPQYESLTDLILTDSFLFDGSGAFLLDRYEFYTDTSELLPADSEEAAAEMQKWLKELRKKGGNFTEHSGTRYWFSLTPADEEAIGSAALLDGQTREDFVQSVATFAAKHGMYGVELNWGHPTTPEGLQAFRLTVTALAEALHEAGLKCAVSLDPADPTDMTAAEFEAIDYLNCMTFSGLEQTDRVKALMPYAKTDEAVDAVVAEGCDSAKIWLGLPYMVYAEEELSMPEPESAVFYIDYLRTARIIASEGEDLQGANSFAATWIEEDHTESISILYNGVNLIRDKAAYAAANGFAGVMNQMPEYDVNAFSDGETDDLSGTVVDCSVSLLRTVYDTVCRFTGVDPAAGLPSGDLTRFDGAPWTADHAGDTLELDLGAETLINRIHLNEKTYGAVQSFHIEAPVNGVWTKVYDNDYILSDRSCILPEDVTASAVRLVVDSLCEPAVIDGFSADYQGGKNPDFMNVGYVSYQWYDMGWEEFESTDAQLSSMTDLIMNGGFTFNGLGQFYITRRNGGTAQSYEPDDPVADHLVQMWIDKLKDGCTNLKNGRTRLWFSLTAYERSMANSTAFLDETVRRDFAKDVAAFAQRNGFYGVDVDWEYPDGSEDALRAFRLTLATLSEELHAVGLKLSSTVCPNYNYFLGAEEFKVLDYVSWMTYTNMEKGENVQAHVTYYKMKTLIEDSIARGCKPSQIWVGLPCFFQTPVKGLTTETYRSLVSWVNRLLNPKGTNRIVDEYYYNGPYLLQDKVAYAAETGCAGVMTWWPGQDIKAFYDDEYDDFYGGRISGDLSLIRAIFEAVRRFTGVDTLDDSPSILPGDVDQNGTVTVIDALAALRFSVGLEIPDETKTALADMDHDGAVSVIDALSILRIAVGLA